MHNLNVSLAASAASAANSLLAESTCTTPRTPEILNSLIAMTNPLDAYAFGEEAPKMMSASGNMQPSNLSSDSNSSSSSQVESPTTNPPSIQHTCSQLIKAGLKLSIEQKRKQHGGDDLLDLDKVKRIKRNESESEDDRFKHENGILPIGYDEYDVGCFGLTPEDEERRRRRRERNKIAATKCRLKKRERTANLINESETLEAQNIELKTQLQELRTQQRTLNEMLTLHRPHCPHNIGPATREHLYRLPPTSTIMETHSYSRPPSVDSGYRNQNLQVYPRAASVGIPNSVTYTTRSPMQYDKPPSIIVEEIGDYTTHFTDLDGIVYDTQCHNYPTNSNYETTPGMDNGCMA